MTEPVAPAPSASPPQLTRATADLGIESIVVKTRWFGIAMGFTLVETRAGTLHDLGAIRACLVLGTLYTILDTWYHFRGKIFLKRWPLFVSLMEAVFIAVLCYCDEGLDSPFRYYYLLSLLCCAFRYTRDVAWLTFGFHCASLTVLAWSEGQGWQQFTAVPLLVVILAWVTWAGSSLASLLKMVSSHLSWLNANLERNRADLERRVADRTAALRASQALVIHQEKMAAFGLLAAGIAHEVGNPLAAISSLVQMLQRHGTDPYTSEKLNLVGSQLSRIQRTIRELVDFSRPASTLVIPVRLSEIVEEALGIAKYYHRTKEREIMTDLAPDLPAVRAIKDRLTQVVLNLLINAIDATSKGGRIHLRGRRVGEHLEFLVEDNGRGVGELDRPRLFEPYFTTKSQGTGLGLFVSRQIIEELGGRLTFRAPETGGAVFVVRLPIGSGKVAPTVDADAGLGGVS